MPRAAPPEPTKAMRGARFPGGGAGSGAEVDGGFLPEGGSWGAMDRSMTSPTAR